MPRAKGGPKTRRRRKKILKQAKGYVGGRRKLYRTAAETVLRAGAFAYRGRKQKKRRARALWIVRIDAACRQVGLSYSDRKSTRLNSSHTVISYAVFCLKKKID